VQRVIVSGVGAMGVGLFCVAGTVKAFTYGLGLLPAAVLGVVPAVGGG
jgi:uncharacterized membrane protein YeiH